MPAEAAVQETVTVGVTVNRSDRALLNWYADTRGVSLASLLFVKSAKELIDEARAAHLKALKIPAPAGL